MGIMRRTFGRGWLYAIHLAWRSGGVPADAPTIQPDVLWAERFEGWWGLSKTSWGSPREAGHKPAF